MKFFAGHAKLETRSESHFYRNCTKTNNINNLWTFHADGTVESPKCGGWINEHFCLTLVEEDEEEELVKYAQHANNSSVEHSEMDII